MVVCVSYIDTGIDMKFINTIATLIVFLSLICLVNFFDEPFSIYPLNGIAAHLLWVLPIHL